MVGVWVLYSSVFGLYSLMEVLGLMPQEVRSAGITLPAIFSPLYGDQVGRVAFLVRMRGILWSSLSLCQFEPLPNTLICEMETSEIIMVTFSCLVHKLGRLLCVEYFNYFFTVEHWFCGVPREEDNSHRSTPPIATCGLLFGAGDSGTWVEHGECMNRRLGKLRVSLLERCPHYMGVLREVSSLHGCP